MPRLCSVSASACSLSPSPPPPLRFLRASMDDLEKAILLASDSPAAAAASLAVREEALAFCARARDESPPSSLLHLCLSGLASSPHGLLRAAQDAVLLKLQANSHLVSSSSSAASNLPAPSFDPAAPGSLGDDLPRRFDALRSRPLPAPKHAEMDEMEARFAALKGAAASPEKETRVRLEDLGGESEDEDEVDKVMKWAMDAARLDVATAGGSTASAEEEKEKDKSSVSSEEEDDDDERLELEMMEKKRKDMMETP